MTTLTIDVAGTPAPQGSKKHVGRGVMVESSKAVKPWREAVKWAAIEAHDGPPLDGPLSVLIMFQFQRPKGHYGTGRNAAQVKASAPHSVAVKPDIDKLLRACLDALTGVIFRDDAQVVRVSASKTYGPRPGAHIEVTPLFAEARPYETEAS